MRIFRAVIIERCTEGAVLVRLGKTESLLFGGYGDRLPFPLFHFGRDGAWNRSGSVDGINLLELQLFPLRCSMRKLFRSTAGTYMSA